MTIFQFYQKREFGTLISDTFNFFKIYFRDFFKNYLIINGAIIFSFIVIVFLLFGTNFSQFIQSLDMGLASAFWTLFIVFILLMFIVLFVSCFPLAYAGVAEENSERNVFSATEIFNKIKPMLGRMFLFGFISIFILTIPMFIIILISYFIPIVGPLLAQGAISVFVGQLMIFYVKDKMGYFEAISKAFDILKEDFWAKIGSTIVMNMISSFIMVIVFIIPILISFFGLLAGIESSLSEGTIIGMGLLGIVWGIAIILVFILSNMNTFLQLMIYYSSHQDKQTYLDLEQIGKNTYE
ncbi:hypothetical protein [Capnocytophaga catalasegens]|uniref:Glycerophosphoryl diester phosphodiesterase membrane domain-containing protein n=1 Tax=Capnocytophaga catalasegens TaxID=1004260 RepID=A0AAV5ASK1_9FLAO|nr:hypothetical protein [Capnocytophaga catalasegens]GIZ16469.1 hypothetical protein RCZ03_24690 [Capnocytophaga catalasegens]GJM50292.1 hypothetical protein RCZ15_12650 [Capnocytophaga catalasegens]GJM53809.1 hypothetical protein RCZ16_21250 [Capnocytophaga catalasegens]